jgi:hypothetical protein
MATIPLCSMTLPVAGVVNSLYASKKIKAVRRHSCAWACKGCSIAFVRAIRDIVFLFLRRPQASASLLPTTDGLQGLLPPARPRATPAHYLGSCLVVDVFQTAMLE